MGGGVREEMTERQSRFQTGKKACSLRDQGFNYGFSIN